MDCKCTYCPRDFALVPQLNFESEDFINPFWESQQQLFFRNEMSKNSEEEHSQNVFTFLLIVVGKFSSALGNDTPLTLPLAPIGTLSCCNLV